MLREGEETLADDSPERHDLLRPSSPIFAFATLCLTPPCHIEDRTLAPAVPARGR